MTLRLVLRELARRKLLVAVGAVLAVLAGVASVSNVSLVPPKIGGGTLEYYNGRTQILVDSSSSTIGDLRRDLLPQIARANVYSRFMTTPAALRLIGRKAGVPPNEIYAEGPYQLGQARFIQEPTAERRGSQLAGRKARYRLRFDSDPELPLVTVYAEAPTAKTATALADGAAAGLDEYVTTVQNEQDVPEKQRVSIRQLGSTTGAPVSDGASAKVAIFVFSVVLGLWCLGILVLARIRAGWQRSDVVQEEFEVQDHFADDQLFEALNPPRGSDLERIN